MRTPEVERWISNEKERVKYLRSIIEHDGYVSTGAEPFDTEKVVAYIEKLEKENAELKRLLKQCLLETDLKLHWETSVYELTKKIERAIEG